MGQRAPWHGRGRRHVGARHALRSGRSHMVSSECCLQRPDPAWTAQDWIL